MVEQNGALRPKLAKGNVRLSTGGSGPFASMTLDRERSFGLSWPTELPRPQIKGNVATYVGAAGPSADLVVTALPTGFRHDIVLRERPTGPVEYRIPVQAKGLKLGKTKSGGLSLTAGKGKEVASAPAPLMWDAAAEKPSAGSPGRQDKIDTSVEVKDDATVLVLKPDAAWLADPATQYPVTVDPTTTLGVTQEVGIKSPNSQIAPGRVGRQNYRTCTGEWPNQTCADRPESLRALMAFDTTPIANRNVVKATMQLTLRTDASSCLVNYQSIFAHRITDAWVADDTFWSRQPATTAEGRSSINPCIQPQAAGAVWSWDLTTMAQAWASGTANHGLMLQLGTETTPASNASENFDFWPQLWSQNVPKLSVDWVLPPEIPTVAAESIDSLSGTDAIARSTAVKVTYKSSVPEASPLDYTVSVNDSTMTPPPAQLPTGEAAYWKLDETSGNNAADASGHGLKVTLAGNYSRVPGQVGQALKLSGGSGATSGPVLNTDQSYTVTAWVKLEDSTKDQVVFSQQGVNQPAFTLAYARSTVPEVDQRWVLTLVTQDISDRINERWAVSKNIARVGGWSHLAVQYDQTAHKIRLFVDGELADERDHTVDWNARGAFQFGKGQIAGIRTPFTGAIDDVHAYQRVLSPADLRTMVTAPGTTTNNGVPAGQIPERIFSLDNPASFKFVVKACRTGVTPPSCNESPAYRITSDAAMRPTDTETGMADPTQPILSGMVNRPSGGPVLAKYYLYDNTGAPVGSAPLGTRTVNGGERASFQIPANTVQAGTTYKWQMIACAPAQNPDPGPNPNPTPTPTPTPSPTPDGLVAAYGMNEGAGTTITDSTGANNGTTSGATWVDGKNGKALSFDGSSMVNINHSPSLTMTTGLTLSAWVKPSDVTSWRTVVAKDYATRTDLSYGLYASNNRTPDGWLNTENNKPGEVTGSALLPLNAWNHLALTYDGTTARLFLNGSQIGEKAISGAVLDDGGAVHIGGNTIYGEYFKGTIDEVRIYNRAQTAAEITADMGTAVTGAGPSPSTATSRVDSMSDADTGGLEEVCTAKTGAVSFTIPGTPPPNPVEDVRRLTLARDSIAIKTVKTDPTACNGNPCPVTDDTVIRIGGTGTDKSAAAIALKLDELPDGAGVSEGILKLGAPVCPSGTCPADAVISARPLKNPVTVDTKGSDLEGDADLNKRYDFPIGKPQADIAGSEYQWLLLTSNVDAVISFADATSTEQPSIAITYLPAGPPSEVLNLSVQAGDSSAVASWGLPTNNGSVALLDGYDVQVNADDGTAVKNLEVKEPYAAITGLTNGAKYTVKVRAKTAFGSGDWVTAEANPKALPPPPAAGDACIPFLDQSQPARASTPSESSASSYIARVKKYYEAQNAVLEGLAPTIWEAPGVSATAPNTAKLSLLNTALIQERQSLTKLGEPRKNLTVALDNAAVTPGANGTINVTTEVKRTWDAPAKSQSATAGTQGEVDPGTFSISVHVFDRCGNMTVIQVPYATYEDWTDNADSCAGQVDGSFPTSMASISSAGTCSEGGSGGGSGGGSAGQGICLKYEMSDPSGQWKCEKPGFKTSTLLIKNEYTPKGKKRKGWGITVDAGSYWFARSSENDGLGETVWDLATNRNFPSTDPGTFYNYIRVWSQESKTNTAEAKYIKRNLAIKSVGEACFLNNKYSSQIGFSIEIDGARSPSGGVNGTVQGNAEVTCKSYEAAGPLKPSDPNPGEDFELQPVWNKRRVKAECFQNMLQYCQVEAYRHYFRAEVTFCYHVTKSTARCIPWENNDYYSWWMTYWGKRYGSS
ncbi:LamG-like jellyroll fold domain-containing protein [Nonomuraea sp. NPDC050383]|uniref:LamG-like jellyroll fold domain-containing protein n=1 Tax=Nonomuraea sp. NPDC050383 TaxID=3364362 RepID=UPI0037B238E3